MKNFFHKYFEVVIWLAGLFLLAFYNPAADNHFSLCIFKLIGFESCPGCGLGHSISWILHGNLYKSFDAHPLGSLALIILIHRIYNLAKPLLIFSFKTKL